MMEEQYHTDHQLSGTLPLRVMNTRTAKIAGPVAFKEYVGSSDPQADIFFLEAAARAVPFLPLQEHFFLSELSLVKTLARMSQKDPDAILDYELNRNWAVQGESDTIVSSIRDDLLEGYARLEKEVFPGGREPTDLPERDEYVDFASLVGVIGSHDNPLLCLDVVRHLEPSELRSARDRVIREQSIIHNPVLRGHALPLTLFHALRKRGHDASPMMFPQARLINGYSTFVGRVLATVGVRNHTEEAWRTIRKQFFGDLARLTLQLWGWIASMRPIIAVDPEGNALCKFVNQPPFTLYSAIAPTCKTISLAKQYSEGSPIHGRKVSLSRAIQAEIRMAMDTFVGMEKEGANICDCDYCSIALRLNKHHIESGIKFKIAENYREGVIHFSYLPVVEILDNIVDNRLGLNHQLLSPSWEPFFPKVPDQFVENLANSLLPPGEPGPA